MIIKEIKVKPYRNKWEPVIDFKETKVILTTNHLEYFINYKYEAEVEDITGNTVMDEFIIYDTGCFDKSTLEPSITCEDYGDDGPELSYILQIKSYSSGVAIRVETLREAKNIYKQIKEWKYEQN